MNVSLATTSALYGATVVNHLEVIGLSRDGDGTLNGARVRDLIPECSGSKREEFEIRAKGIINATGPFTDGIRKLDDPTTQEIITPSSGVHITLPNYYSPTGLGLLDPSTSDGQASIDFVWRSCLDRCITLRT